MDGQAELACDAWLNTLTVYLQIVTRLGGNVAVCRAACVDVHNAVSLLALCQTVSHMNNRRRRRVLSGLK